MVANIVAQVEAYLRRYVILPDHLYLVVSAWVVAAWLANVWDRFGHLAVTSPTKRCAKTRLLELLKPILPGGRFYVNISPAIMYRTIEESYRAGKIVSLLVDEAQSLSRRGSESSEIVRELFGAGIDRNALVTRCGGPKMDQVREYHIYCPKVASLIGALDGVLADRCIPVEMRRRNRETEPTERYRSRVVDAEAKTLHDSLSARAEQNQDRAQRMYDGGEIVPFDVENERMAELLEPLQIVLTLAGDPRMPVLRQYALDLEKTDDERESSGVRLLKACREIFSGKEFLGSDNLHSALLNRDDEPWGRWNHGQPMTKEALANLLKPFGIRPGHSKDRKCRGYYAADFRDAWGRYLSTHPCEIPSDPSSPSRPSPAAALSKSLKTRRTAK